LGSRPHWRSVSPSQSRWCFSELQRHNCRSPLLTLLKLRRVANMPPDRSPTRRTQRACRGGGSDRDAIRSGLAAGARVIVAAALIMIAVFGSFILNGDPTVKQFGVGLSVGVALAAMTVLVFAPAFLVLAGRASWWVPAWADRLLPRVDIEGANYGKGA